jgi:cytochrome P450
MSDRERLNEAVSIAREYDNSKGEFLDHEFETHRVLRENLPIARIERKAANPLMGGGWLLTRYDDATEVLKDPENFSNQIMNYAVRPWIPQAVDPPQHTAYRRILNPWFTADAMKKLEPHLEQYANDLVSKMVAKEAFDFVAEFADPFPTVIFCELAGFPMSDYPQIMDWKNTIMHASDGHSRGRQLALARAKKLGIAPDEKGEYTDVQMFQVRADATRETYAYFAGLIAERRARPKDDIVSKLIDADYEGTRKLTQEELEDTLFLLFMAGLDTVASVLGLSVRHFATDAAKRREFVALMEDESRVGEAIEELVRFHSIVITPRRMQRDLVFHGARFLKDDIVSIPTQAVNRDPAEFPNPDLLDYARAPNRHVGFGLGPHRCLGIHLARRELRIALQVFHRACPDYALDPSRRPEVFGGMKGVSSLPLRRA